MKRWYKTILSITALGLLCNLGFAVADDDDDDERDSYRSSSEFKIESSTWFPGRALLYIKVKADKRQVVQIENALDPNQVLAREYLREDELKLWLRNPQPVPCRIRAVNVRTGAVLEEDVRNRWTGSMPDICAPKDGEEPPDENQLPTADAGPDQNLTLASGQSSITVNLNGSGSSDPDGTISSYVWTGNPNPADVQSPSVTLGEGTYQFSLVVTDNDGGTSSADSVSITVNPAQVENVPPVANAGPDQTITLASGQSSISVGLNGAASSDSDGTVVGYTWSGTPNPADVAAPSVLLAEGTHVFTLVATDNDGAQSEPDSVTITVEAAPDVNEAPLANAGNDRILTLEQGQSSVNVTLNGSGSSDSDGTVTGYSWSGSPNPADVSMPVVSLAEGTYVFSLVVTDNDGAQSQPDSVTITVEAAPPINTPPVAYAGIDQTLTLAQGQTTIDVTLNGNGSSDTDGSVVGYTWSGSPNPADVASPQVSLAAGSYVFTLVVTDNDGDESPSDSVSITVEEAPVVNQAPVANAGPDQLFTLGIGQSSVVVTLDGRGSFDSDGSITDYAWTGNPNPADADVVSVTLEVGTHLFSLVVTDNDGASSAVDTVQVIVNPYPSTAEEAHASISVYEGPSTCVACHEDQAVEMHGSVHYQQTGPAINLTNIVPSPDNPEGLAGERGNGAIGINTYCGSHENSPRFTCAGCHVGNGRFPKPVLPTERTERLAELSNIDCMTCHQEDYKRFPMGEFEPLRLVAQGSNGLPQPGNFIELTGPSGIPVVDPVTLDFQFEPADSESLLPTPLMGSRHEAARTVHKTTRKSCLNCHAGAGGGDGTKRGDISSVLENPSLGIDIHMSPAGGDMTCADCHDAGGHRLKGRGLDLRPNDVDERFTCDGCHTQPHSDYSNTVGSSLDKHASRVACETCHIPTYAKGLPTEVSRDWQKPHFSAAACNGRGGWLPEEIKQGNLTPSYEWFDGTSQVYVLGESLDDYLPMKTLSDGTQAYTIGKPNGSVSSIGAKIYPMKEHLSRMAINDSTNQLIAHSTFEFFRTGDFDAAVQSALEQTGQSGASYHIAQVHTFQTISHGVESTGAALECGDCHNDSRLSGGPQRMNLQEDLGYELKGTVRQVCSQCHGYESPSGFVRDHDRHVRDKRYDCSSCHNFSRPERGLRIR